MATPKPFDDILLLRRLEFGTSPERAQVFHDALQLVHDDVAQFGGRNISRMLEDLEAAIDEFRDVSLPDGPVVEMHRSLESWLIYHGALVLAKRHTSGMESGVLDEMLSHLEEEFEEIGLEAPDDGWRGDRG